MTRQLPLFGQKNGRRRQIIGYALVDEWAFSWLSQWHWNIVNGYVARFETVVPGRGGRRECIYLHRLLVNPPDGLQVDHINRDKLDNRIVNLRVVTDAENKHNVPARGGSSAYRGVSWDSSRQKWAARVKANGHTHNIGRFDSERDAAIAAEQARAELLPLAEGMF